MIHYQVIPPLPGCRTLHFGNRTYGRMAVIADPAGAAISIVQLAMA